MASPSRRGSYSILMSAAIFLIFAFGMMAVDITLMRLAQQQTQDVADAASQAALLMYRVNAVEDGAAIAKQKAEGIASLVIHKNGIVGEPAENFTIDWGTWDNIERVWDSANDATPNGVKVTVARNEDQPVGYVLAPIFGHESFTTSRPSISAIRSLEVVLSMDITGSWDKDDFYNARNAALAFLDELHGNHGPDDVIGMTLFHSRYGWEYTRFTNIADSAANPNLIQRAWQTDLNIGNVAGDFQPAWVADANKHIACKAYGAKNDDGLTYPWGTTWPCAPGNQAPGAKCYDKNKVPGGNANVSYMNNWNPVLPVNPAIPHRGSCHPNMPHYYDDESGTDHSVGLSISKFLFEERTNPMAYRALVMLTDGKPVAFASQNSNSVSDSGSWSKGRISQDYREYESTLSLPYDGSGRTMRQYKHGVSGLKTRGSGADSAGPGHSVANIKALTKTLANRMFEEDNINIWFVSFVAEDDFFVESAQGDGYFAKADTAEEIKPIFVQIARSLPAAIVE